MYALSIAVDFNYWGEAMSEFWLGILSAFSGVFLAAILSIVVNAISNKKQRNDAAKAELKLKEKAANAAWELLLVNVEAFSETWNTLVWRVNNEENSTLIRSVIVVPYEIILSISQYDSECGIYALKARNYINNYHNLMEDFEAHPRTHDQYVHEIVGRDSLFQELFETIRTSSPKHT